MCYEDGTHSTERYSCICYRKSRKRQRVETKDGEEDDEDEKNVETDLRYVGGELISPS